MKLFICSFCCHLSAISFQFIAIGVLGVVPLKMPSLRGWQAKTVQFFNACEYLPPYPSAPPISPPGSSEKLHFSLKNCRETMLFEKKRSIGFGICAEVPTSDYPEIYVGVSLTLSTLGIHHCVQKEISCFASIVPLLHFSITDGCHSVTI